MLSISTSPDALDITFALRPEQKEVLANLRRFNVLLAHRRLGKTVLAIVILLIKALQCTHKRPQVGYYCPTFSQAKKVAWPYLRDFCSAFPGTLFNEAELRVTLEGGQVIQLGSADNPDSSRGMYWDFVVLDEPAQMPQRMWSQVIRPSLSDRKGGALFIGTPAGRHGLLYDTYNAAASDPEWFSGMYRASETSILEADELRSAQRTMSAEEYAQEYECSWDAAIRGAYYARAMLSATVSAVGHESDKKVHIALDLGMNDATAAWFFQVDGNVPRFIAYAEYTNMGLPEIVADWRARSSPVPYAYGKVIVPPDIMVRSLSTGNTRLDTLRNLGVDAVVAPSQSINDGIEAVRMLLPRCRFDAEQCAEGIEALRQYRADWQDKKGVLMLSPLHDWTSHGADAMRYLAVTGLAALGDEWSNEIDYKFMGRAAA